jgi:hypothetical protein
MHDKKELCASIRSLYPEIGQCGIEVNVEFEEGKKVWAVDLQKDTHHLRTYLDLEEANTCMEGKQCISLGVQIGQLVKNIKLV